MPQSPGRIKVVQRVQTIEAEPRSDYTETRVHMLPPQEMSARLSELKIVTRKKVLKVHGQSLNQSVANFRETSLQEGPKQKSARFVSPVSTRRVLPQIKSTQSPFTQYSRNGPVSSRLNHSHDRFGSTGRLERSLMIQDKHFLGNHEDSILETEQRSMMACTTSQSLHPARSRRRTYANESKHLRQIKLNMLEEELAVMQRYPHIENAVAKSPNPYDISTQPDWLPLMKKECDVLVNTVHQTLNQVPPYVQDFLTTFQRSLDAHFERYHKLLNRAQEAILQVRAQNEELQKSVQEYRNKDFTFKTKGKMLEEMVNQAFMAQASAVTQDKVREETIKNINEYLAMRDIVTDDDVRSLKQAYASSTDVASHLTSVVQAHEKMVNNLMYSGELSLPDQQIKLRPEFAENFIQAIKHRVGQVQKETSLRTLQRTQKIVEMRDMQNQVASEEIDRTYSDLLQAAHIKIRNLEQLIGGQAEKEVKMHKKASRLEVELSQTNTALTKKIDELENHKYEYMVLMQEFQLSKSTQAQMEERESKFRADLLRFRESNDILVEKERTQKVELQDKKGEVKSLNKKLDLLQQALREQALNLIQKTARTMSQNQPPAEMQIQVENLSDGPSDALATSKSKAVKSSGSSRAQSVARSRQGSHDSHASRGSHAGQQVSTPEKASSVRKRKTPKHAKGMPLMTKDHSSPPMTEGSPPLTQRSQQSVHEQSPRQADRVNKRRISKFGSQSREDQLRLTDQPKKRQVQKQNSKVMPPNEQKSHPAKQQPAPAKPANQQQSRKSSANRPHLQVQTQEEVKTKLEHIDTLQVVENSTIESPALPTKQASSKSRSPVAATSPAAAQKPFAKVARVQKAPPKRQSTMKATTKTTPEDRTPKSRQSRKSKVSSSSMPTEQVSTPKARRSKRLSKRDMGTGPISQAVKQIDEEYESSLENTEESDPEDFADYTNTNYLAPAKDRSGQDQDTLHLASQQNSLEPGREPDSAATFKKEKRSKRKVDGATMTDPERFLEYLMSFLQILEAKLAKGELRPESIAQGSQMSSSQIGFSGDQYRQENERKMQEVKHSLQRLRNIRAYSGDSYFHSVARVFMATCTVPYDHEFVTAQALLKETSPPRRVHATGGGVHARH